jgi:hypothetical protein
MHRAINALGLYPMPVIHPVLRFPLNAFLKSSIISDYPASKS